MDWRVTTYRNYYFDTRHEAFRFALAQRKPVLVEDLAGDHCWEVYPRCVPRQLYCAHPNRPAPKVRPRGSRR